MVLCLRVLELYRRYVFGPRRERLVEAPRQGHLFELDVAESGLEPWAYLHDMILQDSGDASPMSIAGLLPDRWALAHLEGVLTHRLEESRQRRSVEVNGGRVDRST